MPVTRDRPWTDLLTNLIFQPSAKHTHWWHCGAAPWLVGASADLPWALLAPLMQGHLNQGPAVFVPVPLNATCMVMSFVT